MTSQLPAPAYHPGNANDIGVPVQGLAGVVAAGPYSGDSLRRMADIKDLQDRSLALGSKIQSFEKEAKALVTLAVDSSDPAGTEPRDDQDEGGDSTAIYESASELEKRYRVNLWTMRGLAASTRASLDDFVEVVLPNVIDNTATESEKHQDLRAVIARAESGPEGDSTPLSVSFAEAEKDFHSLLGKAITECMVQSAVIKTNAANLAKTKEKLEKQLETLGRSKVRKPHDDKLISSGAPPKHKDPKTPGNTAEDEKRNDLKRQIDLVTSQITELLEAQKAIDTIRGRVEKEIEGIPKPSEVSECILEAWKTTVEAARTIDSEDLSRLESDEVLLLKIQSVEATTKAYSSALYNLATALEG
ncbi:hypothetical protein CC1G_11129 [Coprinopsis cinerea okayama7|uniref:Uncharacterized protein n=1 Tax=Coprinopsis cinerea (strain Okayama-7 / 130 / ATCC MYA-4618 / FGSC 9003) TaxID=240176 RepID=A8N4R4_COPC7|nr:hypothetical protein CC1G_11129 [Coprinopsis cinerea okayama7\|eukprot:XP_001829859.1 hypothetical protein CC1G_11129 [Coprinopsis cinerea okayama7\